MGKSPKVKLVFGTLTMGKGPRNEICFYPLKQKKTQWDPEMCKSPGENLSLGDSPNEQSPE
jgi:hypothetical protein